MRVLDVVEVLDFLDFPRASILWQCKRKVVIAGHEVPFPSPCGLGRILAGYQLIGGTMKPRSQG